MGGNKVGGVIGGLTGSFVGSVAVRLGCMIWLRLLASAVVAAAEMYTVRIAHIFYIPRVC